MKPALDQTFLQCRAKLYRFALSLAKNEADAQDIFQETLLKIWQQKANWINWENFEAYAMRMVRNVFINYRKKNNKIYVDLAELPETATPNDMERQMNLTDLRMRFLALIDKLPAIQRSVLYLREIEEFEYKEIGEALELSESQVKVYLFRGRQYIKSKTYGKRED